MASPELPGAKRPIIDPMASMDPSDEVAGARWGLKRMILSDADHNQFRSSNSFRRISAFVSDLSLACEGKSMSVDIQVPPVVSRLVEVLEQLHDLVDRHPPIE